MIHKQSNMKYTSILQLEKI